MFLAENIQGYAFAVVEKNYAVQLGVSIYQFDMNVFFFFQLFFSRVNFCRTIYIWIVAPVQTLNCFLNKSPYLDCFQMVTSRIMIFKYVDST